MSKCTSSRWGRSNTTRAVTCAYRYSRQVGEIKAHAVEWKANVRAEFRETRRRLSVEIHDKLQRAATIRSMERRRLGLEQRAQSLDMLSPERRAVFTSLDGGRFKTSSQESIDTKLHNLRLKGAGEHHPCGPLEPPRPPQPVTTAADAATLSATTMATAVPSCSSSSSPSSSEENLFGLRFGSLTKLVKRPRHCEPKRVIPEDVRRMCEAMSEGGGEGRGGAMLGEEVERLEEESLRLGLCPLALEEGPEAAEDGSTPRDRSLSQGRMDALRARVSMQKEEPCQQLTHTVEFLQGKELISFDSI